MMGSLLSKIKSWQRKLTRWKTKNRGNLKVKALRIILMALAFIALQAYAKDESNLVVKEKGSKPTATLNGTWYSATGTTTFNADGTLISNGQRYYYTAKNGVILLAGKDGVVTIPYQLSSGKLTVIVNGETTVYTRNPVAMGNNIGNSNNRAGRISNELLLSSAWCSSSYNAKTGYSSSTRVQLRPNGTYSTGGQNEGYSSGPAGTYASQGNSSGGGRWKVADGELFMAKGNDNLARVQTRIERNSNGYLFIVADGVEYAQCR